MTLEDRFWSKVDARGPDECWEWTAAKTEHGYGRLGVGGNRILKAHRVAWMLANGSYPDGFVCHSCDNPPCCNPAHLWIGTQTDNMRDCVAKGRHGNGHVGKAHCKHGHEYTPENTYWWRGSRHCRACNRAMVSKRRAEQKTRETV